MARLEIGKIERNAGFQIRVKIDSGVVDEYASEIEAGSKFPPITVFAEKNSERYILVDGFHRMAAAEKLGKQTIGVEVIEGTMHDALAYALRANVAHGVRRSNADKSNAVQMALKHPEWTECSLREIADICKVSHELVRIVKADLSKGDKKEVKPRERKEPPTQNEVDRKALLGAMATIRAFPFAGDSAWWRLELEGDIEDIKFCRDWLSEVMAEHDKELG